MLLVLVIIFAVIIFKSNQNFLTVNFLNVGQGDAILISQGKNQILIDGGPSGRTIMEKLGTYVPFWDREIEVILITHPDIDHIEGLVDVLQNYKVDAIIETDVQSDSAVYAKLQSLIKEKNISKIKGTYGTKIKLNEKNELEVLSFEDKNAAVSKETNSSSIVSKLLASNQKFLFIGDLPSEKETEMISRNIDLSADILKIGHHGSKYSTSQEFLDKVNPQDAVISVGKNNRYGHPAPEILERLKNKKINIFRTDTKGDIIYECPNFSDGCRLIAN